MNRFYHFFLFALAFFLGGCNQEPNSTPDYRLAIDPAWTTLNIPERSGDVKAFTVELTEAIALKDGLNIAIYDRTWDNLFPDLLNEEYDGILSTLEPHLFYEKKFAFSDLYLATGPVLIVPFQSKVTQLEELAGKEVGILEGSHNDILIAASPRIIQRNYMGAAEMFQALSAGKIDAALLSILVAEPYCKDLYKGVLKVASPPLTERGLRLVTLYGKSDKLISAFNKGLEQLKKDGSYEALLKKWRVGE